MGWALVTLQTLRSLGSPFLLRPGMLPLSRASRREIDWFVTGSRLDWVNTDLGLGPRNNVIWHPG
jgi:hypothetical protein